jgi:uncharacterized protein YprB with RNaseH-like and TPR domain
MALRSGTTLFDGVRRLTRNCVFLVFYGVEPVGYRRDPCITRLSAVAPRHSSLPAVRVDHSFIPVDGIGPKTERSLWEQGVTHWDAFDRSAVGSTQADRIESFIEIARDHLDRGNVRFFGESFPSDSHWRLYETFPEQACFLDIETTGLDQAHNDVTVVSLHRHEDTTTLVRGRDLSAERLRSELAQAGLLVTFNGKRFDVPFLESEFGLSIDHPHLDLMYPCRRLDLTGGLKAIEEMVGIDRARPDISGRDAVRLWH